MTSTYQHHQHHILDTFQGEMVSLCFSPGATGAFHARKLSIATTALAPEARHGSAFGQNPPRINRFCDVNHGPNVSNVGFCMVLWSSFHNFHRNFRWGDSIADAKKAWSALKLMFIQSDIYICDICTLMGTTANGTFTTWPRAPLELLKKWVNQCKPFQSVSFAHMILPKDFYA